MPIYNEDNEKGYSVEVVCGHGTSYVTLGVDLADAALFTKADAERLAELLRTFKFGGTFAISVVDGVED